LVYNHLTKPEEKDMTTIILVIHLILAVLLVGIILLQKSEGGGLGLGGGGGMSGFLTTRGSANLLTRATAWLAALFFITSLALVVLADNRNGPDIPTVPPSFIPPPITTAPTPNPTTQPSIPVGQ